MAKPPHAFQRHTKTRVELPLSALHPYKGNAAYRTSDAALAGIYEAIAEDGKMLPYSVVKEGNIYRVGDGNRSLACHKRIYKSSPDTLVECYLWVGLTCAQLVQKLNYVTKGWRGSDWLSHTVHERTIPVDMPEDQHKYIDMLVEIHGSIVALQFLVDLGHSPNIVVAVNLMMTRMRDGAWEPPIAEVSHWVAECRLQAVAGEINKAWSKLQDQDAARRFLRARFETRSKFKAADLFIAAGLGSGR